MSRKVEAVYVKLSKLIVHQREKTGLTQEQVAKKAGISRPYLATMESGRTRIYLHHLLKLEKALGSPLLASLLKLKNGGTNGKT